MRPTIITTLLIATTTSACTAGLECGEGTREEDGLCVPDHTHDTDANNETNTETNTDLDGDGVAADEDCDDDAHGAEGPFIDTEASRRPAGTPGLV